MSSGDRTRTYWATTSRADHYTMPTIAGSQRTPVRVAGIEPAGACSQGTRCTLQLDSDWSGEPD